ncbi:MAG: ATP-binding protein, partial [Thermodesulfovibrionales bacterium]
SDGYWLKGEKREDEWGFMYKDRKDLTFPNRFPDAWPLIVGTGSEQLLNTDGLFTFATVYPLFEGMRSSTGSSEAYAPSAKMVKQREYYWKIVSYVTSDALNAGKQKILQKLILLYIVLNILLALIAWFTARTRVQHQRAEDSLKESNARIKSFYEATFEGIAIIRNGKFIDINRRFGEMFGYDQKGLIGKEVMELVDEEDRELVTNMIRSGYDKPYECRALNKDGSIFYVEVHGQSINYQGLPARVTTIHDITERKHAEEEKKHLEDQLFQSQKIEAIGRLAGGIAHDFNNILTAIIANGSILNMELKEDDPLREFVDQILTVSERGAELTHGLLAFSRKQIIIPKPVRLNAIINKSEKILSRLIGEDIELRTELADEDVVIMADSIQIEQVLMNIATNARDAMPDGGTLNIATELRDIDDAFIQSQGFGEPGSYAVITITDTGSGMDEETRQRIFEPFFTSKDLGRGTGLGLATTYGIVKQHNGFINVDSKPHKGTTFTIFFPLTEETIVEDDQAERTETETHGELTILFAEDEEHVRKALRSILETFGHHVIEAIDGEDAVKKFREFKDDIDLLLFDVIMPKKNGKKAFEAIKKMKPNIKCLFTSGYTEDVMNKIGILEKDINFIYKPVTPGELFRKIKEVISK